MQPLIVGNILHNSMTTNLKSGQDFATMLLSYVWYQNNLSQQPQLARYPNTSCKGPASG